MKKTLIVLAFLAAFFVTEKAQAQLNIHVGYMPEFFITKAPDHDTSVFFHGINVGLGWEFELSQKLSLTAGAQYRMDLRDVVDGAPVSNIPQFLYRENQYLIDIPIILKYKLPVSEKFAFSPFAGPMLSYGIKGKTTKTYYGNSYAQVHYNWYDSNSFPDRPNRHFNLYAMAGVEIDILKFSISLGGQYGFLNLNKQADTTTKGLGFFVNFGHKF